MNKKKRHVAKIERREKIEQLAARMAHSFANHDHGDAETVKWTNAREKVCSRVARWLMTRVPTLKPASAFAFARAGVHKTREKIVVDMKHLARLLIDYQDRENAQSAKTLAKKQAKKRKRR